MNLSRPDSKANSRFWTIGYREARTHALIGGAILWLGFSIVTLGSKGDRNLLGYFKGEDFLQIYTLAHLAFEGPYPTPATQARFHARQVELVPGSEDVVFLPVYPPTAALIFRPAAGVSYLTALSIWTVVTMASYGWIIRRAWRPVRDALPDARFIAIAAISFPPFFLLVLFGQTTAVPLSAFFLCWLALKGDRPVLAGIALGLLSVKPQFGLVIGLAILFGGNWAVFLGLVISAAIQYAGIAWVMGPQAIWAYVSTLSELSTIEPFLEPAPWRMHSLRTVTRLLPQPAGGLVWAAMSAWVVLLTIRIWRSTKPLEVRLGMVLFATVLVNPHLFGYDAVVLALPILWLGGSLVADRSPFAIPFWQATYLLFVLLLLPTALFLAVQASVLVMLWMFGKTARALEKLDIRPPSAT